MKNGRPKKAKEKKRETLKNKKCSFFGEKQVFQLEAKKDKKKERRKEQERERERKRKRKRN